jgi:hypothetical protein
VISHHQRPIVPPTGGRNPANGKYNSWFFKNHTFATIFNIGVYDESTTLFRLPDVATSCCRKPGAG